MIVSGMWLQAIAIIFIAVTSSYAPWIVGAILLGVGTAFVYPTLLAAIGDVANPSWRASVVGVYRLWRDSSYAVVAVLAGVAADLFGFATAILTVGILTAISGLVVAVRMRETLPRG
jgi:MFS family permease